MFSHSNDNIINLIGKGGPGDGALHGRDFGIALALFFSFEIGLSQSTLHSETKGPLKLVGFTTNGQRAKLLITK